jgi:hypothetical protein
MMDLDSELDPDPAVFVSDLLNNKKLFFCLFFFEGSFTSFFKDKKSHTEVTNHKTVGISVFLTIFA